MTAHRKFFRKKVCEKALLEPEVCHSIPAFTREDPMELKVECACGARFKFEVEPVRGRMPAPVSCPSCGADTTSQANHLLRLSLSANQPAAVAAAQHPAAVPAERIVVRINRPAATPGAAPSSIP